MVSGETRLRMLILRHPLRRFVITRVLETLTIRCFRGVVYLGACEWISYKLIFFLLHCPKSRLSFVISPIVYFDGCIGGGLAVSLAL
jgi:hypothetical protein